VVQLLAHIVVASIDLMSTSCVQVFELHKIDASYYKSHASEVALSPDLVCRIGMKLYPWQEAAPLILGMLAFGGR
jgi:Lipin/Ned1/Smp2 multi-domain protein middle domain